MASSSTPTPSPKIYEGVFAVNKPPGISSAQVIRDVQDHFKSSKLFQPWLAREEALKDAESHNQKRKRKSWKQRQPLQVKMGHGGTLDPMATGVLILGVGSGTKQLSTFLECTKSYDTTLLFGAATDSYDAVGKIVARKSSHHITKAMVEQKLSQFRGKIMQRPPIFSALKVQGKPLYQYAREGKQVPIEIEERPVEVKQLEMAEWLEGGTHDYHWPSEEADDAEKQAVEKTFHLDTSSHAGQQNGEGAPGGKRKREDDGGDDINPENTAAAHKRTKSETIQHSPSAQQVEESKQNTRPPCPAPACRLRMTVTSGFYVRSLCHDLGAAVGSLGLMADLVRTRQADFELSKNVLEYDDLSQGEDHWGPKVKGMLESWMGQNGGRDPDGSEADDDPKTKRASSKQRSRDPPASPPRLRRENTSSEER